MKVFVRSLFLVLFLTMCISVVWAVGDEGPEVAAYYVFSTDPTAYSSAGWVHEDRDNDGNTDYVVLYSSGKIKIQEVYDYSRSGSMDDFYFYDDDGLLIRRELDSTNDGQIDIWVHIVEGNYIGMVERDTDGDGEIDYVRTYGEED